MTTRTYLKAVPEQPEDVAILAIVLANAPKKRLAYEGSVLIPGVDPMTLEYRLREDAIEARCLFADDVAHATKSLYAQFMDYVYFATSVQLTF